MELEAIDVQWPDYTFTVPTKESEELEDLRGILRRAKEEHARGENP